MRDERKLNKALRQDGIDTQADILDELKRKYPQYAVRQKSDGTVKRKRIAVFSSLAAVAACAAVIIPCAVLLPEINVPADSGYCSFDDSSYSIIPSDYTMREYSEMSGGKILYFDWYDIAGEYDTNNYRSNANGKIFAAEEWLYLTETDELIYLVVTATNVYINTPYYNVKKYTKKHDVGGHTVKWVLGDNALCMLEDSGYRYFIRIDGGQDETRLFELASELLQKN